MASDLSPPEVELTHTHVLHKKGMMPLDMHLFLTSLEAIERACTQEKASAQSKKASYKSKKSNKQPGTKPMARVPKKAHKNTLHTI